MQRYFKYLSHYRFKYLSFRIFAFRMNESVTQRSFAKQNFQFGWNIIQINIFWGCQYTTELQTPYHHISCHIDIFHMVFCINKKNNITLRRYVMFYIKHALRNKPLLSTLAVIEKTICFVIFKDWSTLFRLHWEMKGHWSRVNPVKREALLKDLHTTSVLSFPNANEKQLYFNPYIYSQVMKNPQKVEKKNVNFSVTWQVSFIGKFATVFLCFIAGECHWSVNTSDWIKYQIRWKMLCPNNPSIQGKICCLLLRLT